MNKLRVFIFVLVGLTGVLLTAFGLVRAGVLAPPVVVNLQPDPGAHNVLVDSSVSVTYDQDMDPATVNPQSFAVHARQTGWLTGTLSVVTGTITLDPLNPFRAGELVQASATTATLSLGGEAPLKPTVWQFNAAPWGGNAAFHEHQVFGNIGSRNVALGNLDGDGNLDAIAVSCGGFTRILHNDGSGTFTEVQSFDHTTACLLDAELGDLDGDGDLDAMLINLNYTGMDLILLNDGAGHFTQSATHILSHGDTYGKLGDLDGDGYLDLFVASGGFGTGTLRVWKNDGAGNFTLAQNFDAAYEHLDVALGDLDGDGDLDAFTTGWNNSYNKVWLNDGTGAFSQAQAIPNANTYGVQLGDLNGDGYLDAYLANTTIDVTNLPDEVWLNNGLGHFTNSGQSLDTVLSAMPALGDLDADGDLDVYLASEPYAPHPDEVWANDGSGTFTLFRTVDENYAGGGVTHGDLDSDGNLDAFVFGNDYDENGFQVYLNGPWTRAVPVPDKIAAYAFAQCPEDPNSFYIIGGMDEDWQNNGFLNTLMRFDVDTGKWFVLAPVPIAQISASAVCYEGKIYLAGGMGNDGVVSAGLYIYNIAANTWSFDTWMPRLVMGAALGAWDGMIYLIGGTAEDWNQGMHPVNRMEVYNIATHTWTPNVFPHMPFAATAPGYVQAGPYLYLVGGFSGDYNANVTATQRFDLASRQWQVGPAFTSARAFPTVTITEHHLYATGGDENGDNWMDSSDRVEVLDLTDWPNGSWHDLGDPLPHPSHTINSNACTEAMAGGEIWSVGGINGLGPWIFYNNTLYYPAEPCLGHTFAFSLAPIILEGAGVPGETVTYTLHLTNTGDIPDAYTVEIASAWSTSASSLAPLWPGESATLQVTVNVPADALAGSEDTAVVTITSQGDAEQVGEATLTTTAKPVYGVNLATEIPALSGYSGEEVTYTLHVTNLGNITDTFYLSPSGNLWEVTLPITSVVLPVGGSTDVTVHVMVADDASGGDTDAVTVTATSRGDPSKTDAVTLTTTAKSPYGVALWPETGTLTGMAGRTMSYTLHITNTGNITDTFVFSYTEGQWQVHMPVTQTVLAPGETTQLVVYMTVPVDAFLGERIVVTITATSQGDAAKFATSTLTCVAVWQPGYLPVNHN